MSRVVWTNIEKQLVIERMVALLREEPNLTNALVLQRAQEVLPRERRLVMSHSKVFTHKPKIEEARKRARSAGKAVEPPPATCIAPEPPEREETPAERLAGVLDALLDIVADKLADRIAQRLGPAMSREELMQRVDEQFDIELAKRPRHNPLPLAEAKCTGKPGVVIIGLLPLQAGIVTESHGGRLDLVCLTSDQARSRDPVRRAHTILMTKFVSHDLQDKYRKAPGLRWCNGAVTELQQILDTIAPV